MKKSLCLLLLLPALLLFNSCKKEDFTTSTDITAHTWQLERTKINSNRSKTPEKDTNGNPIESESYRLIFSSDTTFTLKFSRNWGSGTYTIPTPGQIDFPTFGITEICCDLDFDTDIFNTIRTIDSYRVLEDELVLEGVGVEYWFLRE